MEKMIAVDRLARPEHHILISAERGRRARKEQGRDITVSPFDEDFLKGRLHGICCGEFQAMEAAGRTLFDFPDAPWEFQLDMARQVWDESRHVEIFQRLLEYMGGEAGDYVETEILWRCTQADPRPACIARGFRFRRRRRPRRPCIRGVAGKFRRGAIHPTPGAPCRVGIPMAHRGSRTACVPRPPSPG